MPIGNLTSQIFANIYMNESDRFVKHELRIKNYLRYGDDFILIHPDLKTLIHFRSRVVWFLSDRLKLSLNLKNDTLIKVSHGLRFLGVMIQPDKRNLNRRNRKRIKNKLNFKNLASYYGLVRKHALVEFRHEFDWWIYELIESEL